jgi:hypothetical protein
VVHIDAKLLSDSAKHPTHTLQRKSDLIEYGGSLDQLSTRFLFYTVFKKRVLSRMLRCKRDGESWAMTRLIISGLNQVLRMVNKWRGMAFVRHVARMEYI